MAEQNTVDCKKNPQVDKAQKVYVWLCLALFSQKVKNVPLYVYIHVHVLLTILTAYSLPTPSFSAAFPVHIPNLISIQRYFQYSTFWPFLSGFWKNCCLLTVSQVPGVLHSRPAPACAVCTPSKQSFCVSWTKLRAKSTCCVTQEAGDVTSHWSREVSDFDFYIYKPYLCWKCLRN